MKSKKGFTLIEIMIAISIAIILAVIIIFVIKPAQILANARDSQRNVHVQSIYSIIKQYNYLNEGVLPICFIGKVADEFFDIKECETDLVPYFINELPLDPIYGTTEITGYLIKKNAEGKIGIKADYHEGEVEIGAGYY